MKDKFDYRKTKYAFMTPEEIGKQKEREKYEKEKKENAEFLNKEMETDEHTTESEIMRDAFYEDSQKGLEKRLREDQNKK